MKNTPTVIIVIIFVIAFVGLGFLLGRSTAPGSDADYRAALSSLIKENEIQRKLVQRYMLMYENLMTAINNLMSGKYYPPVRLPSGFDI